MSFAWSPTGCPASGGQPPRIQHVLYEHDGPKLVLALDDRDRQVLGVAVDEDVKARATRWVFAPAPPAKILGLLQATLDLRDLFVADNVRVFDLGITGEAIVSWELDGASLPDALLPDADVALPELTKAARDQLLHAQLSAGGSI